MRRSTIIPTLVGSRFFINVENYPNEAISYLMVRYISVPKSVHSNFRTEAISFQRDLAEYGNDLGSLCEQCAKSFRKVVQAVFQESIVTVTVDSQSLKDDTSGNYTDRDYSLLFTVETVTNNVSKKWNSNIVFNEDGTVSFATPDPRIQR